ncbi:hypothetical protein BH23GEM3_BH23GEM3_16840 [soil metagenome]|jgi:hypothetical protein
MSRLSLAAFVLPCLVLATALPSHAEGPIYSGAERQLAVQMPRVERAEVRIDGDLSESVWSEAAVLTGFTQSQPAEGRLASERTEVLLFYAPQALYIGVRAYAREPGRIRATLAPRDRIGQDDQIRIFLDTFLDRRRAFALFVNPLGIQQDGIYTEGAARRDCGSDLAGTCWSTMVASSPGTMVRPAATTPSSASMPSPAPTY